MAFVLNYREFLGSYIFRQGGRAKSWCWPYGAEAYVAAAKDSGGALKLDGRLIGQNRRLLVPTKDERMAAMWKAAKFTKSASSRSLA